MHVTRPSFWHPAIPCFRVRLRPSILRRPGDAQILRTLAPRNRGLGWGGTRSLGTQTSTGIRGHRDYVPFRKELKDKAKTKRLAKGKPSQNGDAKLSKDDWELTVGIEVHAQLDTDAKLFSRASTAIDETPNSNVALFDLAFPGSQPSFQPATLIPALRAAIAFHCEIQPVSSFDRKHYFYQDQPAGYQITQYYEPYAKNGVLRLYKRDGIGPGNRDCVEIGIKQIQMEQDTAKSQELPSHTYLLDFNRVSRPLIEIITLPQIHSPATAAACVKKIQAILQACGAVTTGMEMGGLRADVNVSVRRRDAEEGAHGYEGITGLGQRTEIKNLSSFKAVEDAIIAERNRQIAVLEAGGTIEGETRGWTLGSTETRKLRGKEGEVDYRYMPDPDLGPVIIGEDVLLELKRTMPPLPDDILKSLIRDPKYLLSTEDAKTLLDLDDGARLEYYQDTVDILSSFQAGEPAIEQAFCGGKVLGNWVLHELGGLFSKYELPWVPDRVPAQTLAEIVHFLSRKTITGTTAKSLLAMVFGGDTRPTKQIVEEDNLIFKPLSRGEYVMLAESVIQQNPQAAKEIREKGKKGKIGWLLGQMMRLGESGRMEASKAKEILEELLLKQQ
ncbi:aspartyl/glutamyl-tRNA(Asn/Gln) amidotransferase, B subunit [Emydomyces testavorans]|uniref:Glutamyl-tRNA(Gln) amidotransferase subunit B, mitochondrial n=1 Tax=Emydomyces testavorans TaxID=2070801 RepID=A0AAF0DBE6_9EURO|nr:aspartyl/glutamyl-tRNA(Asn/Gln) amidotransferase, B subunit [Emydomyces testavorans]